MEFYFDWNGTAAVKLQSMFLKPQAIEITEKFSTWLRSTSWGAQILYVHFCNIVSGFDLAIKEARWKSEKMPISALSVCGKLPVDAASDEL